jgi:hypothetical protein
LKNRKNTPQAIPDKRFRRVKHERSNIFLMNNSHTNILFIYLAWGLFSAFVYLFMDGQSQTFPLNILMRKSVIQLTPVCLLDCSYFLRKLNGQMTRCASTN